MRGVPVTWAQFRTFLWGSAVVLIDAVVGPFIRRAHERSKR
jgi:hypothetical protein